jgi:hypothetical protein
MSFMQRHAWKIILLVFLFFILAAIFFARPAMEEGIANLPTRTPATPPAASTQTPNESAVVTIPLAGRAANKDAEFSGMAWYGDDLILLPQYPNRFGAGDGALLAIAKADLLAFIDGKRQEPIAPRAIPFKAPGLSIAGFEGYESIAFVGEQVFLTIESKPGAMLGYLVKGKIARDLSAIEIDASAFVALAPQADITNFSDETIVVTKDKLLTLYEANGAGPNPKPVARVFDFKPAAVGTIPFPNIEYRITDATPTDAANKFWAINYFFPGDVKILPLFDPLAQKFGKGKTHTQYPQIERLVEFQYNDAGITLTDTPPMQFVLPNADARNWEGIARLDNRGFLIATDSYPQTILGFVPR